MSEAQLIPRGEQDSFLEMRARIAERYPTLSPQIQAIAQFALANPETMAVETTMQLAKRLNVQPSSLVRFAQALGYRGYNEMKERFRAHLIFRMADTRDQEATRRQKDAGATGVVDAMLTESRIELDRLTGTLDRQAFDRAVEALAGAAQIYVVAQHIAFPFGCLFAWTLLRFGRQCHLLDNVGGFALRGSELAGPRDVTLAISFAPYQPSVVQGAKAHVDLGGTVVAITDTPLSPLAPFAQILLEVPHNDPPTAHSLVGATCLVQALAISVGQR